MVDQEYIEVCVLATEKFQRLLLNELFLVEARAEVFELSEVC